jgi:hypothetical protein
MVKVINLEYGVLECQKMNFSKLLSQGNSFSKTVILNLISNWIASKKHYKTDILLGTKKSYITDFAQ